MTTETITAVLPVIVSVYYMILTFFFHMFCHCSFTHKGKAFEGTLWVSDKIKKCTASASFDRLRSAFLRLGQDSHKGVILKIFGKILVV